MKAKYKCDSCNFKWSQLVGPTQCPRCGHLYCKWLNLKKVEKTWKKRNV